jgi:predicted DNA-binding protein (MmcQ/YjbR family)
MNIEQFREYCLAKPFVTELFPFNETTLVFKVADKMFALCDVDQFEFINLKCDPEEAVDLRERYHGIKPGYHMSKKHWNSVYIGEDVNDKLLLNLTDNSYGLVFSSISKKKRDELQNR